MKADRRNFIKKSLFAAATLFIPPYLLDSDSVNAQPLLELNYKPEISKWSDNDVTISWIGHSTVLINFKGKWILTDPVLFDRIGIYFLGASIGPPRYTPPALSIDELPKPDIILLSHAHMDHTDYPTLDYITKKYPNQIDVITAYLTKDVIYDLPWKSITILDWEEEKILHDINFKAFEVKHFGWRFPWEKDRSRGYFSDGRSYNAYLIQLNGTKVLFCGDTAYTDKLDILRNEDIDVAIMPIGAYDPWRRAHCNPEEALKIARAVKAKHFIPIHCKTFRQGREPVNEPLEWLSKSAPNYDFNIAIDDIGKTFKLG